MRNRTEKRLTRHLGKNTRGMTLIEIMVVIAIIGIVTSAITFGVFTYLKKAKVDACRAQLRKVANVLTIYAAEDDFPSSLNDVVTGDYGLKDKDTKDPWKQDLIYSYPSSRGDSEFDLCSRGPDKQEGTDDDVCYDD